MQKIISSKPFKEILVLKLNNLKHLNALSLEMLLELDEKLEAANHEEKVNCIIITGSSYLFSIGADKRELFSDKFDSEKLKARNKVYRKIADHKLPIIAAVCGPVIGSGFEIALACDIIIAGKSAKFSFPETSLGIIPGGGGTQRLTRIVGKSLSMQIILAGMELNAQEAKEYRIVGNVVDDKECLNTALEIACNIVNRPNIAVQVAKKSILSAMELSIEGGLNLEHDFFLKLRNGEKQEK